MFRLLVFLLLAVPVVPLNAQQATKIDSLKRVLVSSQPDSSKANACNDLSVVFRGRDPDSSLYYANRALALSRKAHFPKGEARALYNEGILISNQGNYVDALEKFYTAAVIDSLIGEKKAYASVLTAMGGQKMYLGDLPGALDYHLRALKIKEELGDSSVIASAVANISTVYNTAGDAEKAKQYAYRSLRLNLKYGKVERVMVDYYTIANILLAQEKPGEALPYLALSERLADSLAASEQLSYVYLAIGSAKHKQGQPAEAIGYFNKALTIAEKNEDLRIMAFAYENLGEVNDSLGNNAKAEAYYLQGLELAKKIGSKEVMRNLHRLLSAFYEKHGDYTDAFRYYVGYIALRDSIIDEEKGKEMTRKELNFGFDKKRALAEAEQKKKDALSAEDKKRKQLIIYAGAAILVLALFFLLFVYNRFRASQRQRKIITEQKVEVEKQKGVIEEKNKDITDSINYAQRIQRAVLPDAVSFTELLPDAFVLFRPKDIVSGDFYWITESDGSIFYATADCTGHGVPGGFMSMLGASLLNEIVIEKKVVAPGAILDQVRERIIRSLRQKGESGENKDGMDMVLCRLDRSRNELSFAAANNPLWLVRPGTAGSELIEYKPDKQPVGIGAENAKPFTQQEIALQPGDIVYTFTDGFADQFGGPKGKKFKYSALKERLLEMRDLPMAEQKAILGKVLEEWKGNLEQVDDVLVIGVKI